MLTPSVPVTSLGGLVDAPAASLPSGTADQIVQALRLQLTRDGGEAHIKLDPQQFGDVSVRVRVEQGQVVARVEAEAAVVREWLQANQHVLRQSLAGQQLTLDRLEVNAPRESADADRERQPSRRDEQPHQRQPQRRRNSSSELFDVVA
jgi:flagellar hook-length control protein FliK